MVDLRELIQKVLQAKDKSELQNEVIEKWINSFNNNEKLVYYGYYKWD